MHENEVFGLDLSDNNSKGEHTTNSFDGQMFTTPSEKYIHQITFNFFFQTLKLNSLQYDTFNTLSEMLIIHVVLVIKPFNKIFSYYKKLCSL